MNLKDHIRHVPDFPKKGILFYDISTLLAHKDAWQEAIRQLAKAVKPFKPTKLAGIESFGDGGSQPPICRIIVEALVLA